MSIRPLTDEERAAIADGRICTNGEHERAALLAVQSGWAGPGVARSIQIASAMRYLKGRGNPAVMADILKKEEDDIGYPKLSCGCEPGSVHGTGCEEHRAGERTDFDDP